jgi:hypothetical protein
MKKLILLFALCLSGMFCETTFAQITLSVNIASQPIWGPVGYDHVEYYYLPDIQTYYYVPGHKYFYMENGRWVSRSYLPQKDSHDSKYFVIKNHPEHSKWKDNKKNQGQNKNQENERRNN